MTDSGDIWQRYDAKVLHIRQLEARVAELESAVATGQHERDHWAGLARQLNKKLQVSMPITSAAYHILYEKISPAVEIELLKEKFK